jgi:hypothetical protein
VNFAPGGSKEINNWLDEFPPFGSNQHFPDDQIKEILYSIIPKRWQSYLHCDKFDMTTASVDDFFNHMERYQIADNIDSLLKPKDQSKVDKNESNKSTEKLNDKKRKAKSKKNDSDAPAPKKSCLIHGEDSSHTTDECRTMREQAYRRQNALVKNANVNSKNKRNKMNFMK